MLSLRGARSNPASWVSISLRSILLAEGVKPPGPPKDKGMKTEGKNKRISGPKPIDETERRKHRVGFRLTDEEYEKATARAKACGLRVGVWFREVALDRPLKIVPPVNKEEWANLGRLGNILNQVLRARGRGDYAQDISPEIIHEIKNEIQRIRKVLMGEFQDD